MPGTTINSVPSAAPQSKGYALPLLMICILFFVFGFITWANSTLIPFFKMSFSLTDTQAFFVTFASYIAYFFLALPASVILKKVGFKNGLSLGLIVLAIGSIIFIPAARSHSYALFLTGIFIQGAALAILQTAANPYLTIIGPIESAAQRISIAGVCNKGAGIIVPLIMGSLFMANSSKIESQLKIASPEERTNLLNETLSRVNTPYITLAIIFILLALVFKMVHLPEVEEEKEAIDVNADSLNQKTSIFQFPHLFLGALCIFFCVAAEVMAGDLIGPYGRELNLDPSKTVYLTSVTLSCMLIGYFIGIVCIPRFISQQKMLIICTIVGMAFSVVSVMSSGNTAILFIGLLGLANSLMWPAIFPLGIQGLGKFTKTGSAIMIMGIAGGAIWPLFYATLKEKFHIHFQSAYFIAIVICYLYILFFAVKGHKVGLKKA